MDAGGSSAGDVASHSGEAPPHGENPSAWLERCFSGRHGQSPVNPALTCAAVGFSRYRGDWIGVLITPWFMDILLLPGGGDLWGDIPVGQRRYVELPRGTVPFTAAADPEIGPYQHSPLVAPVSALTDMATALDLAAVAMRGIVGDAPLPASNSHEGANDGAGAPEAASRRGFFRRLAGRR